MPHDEDHETNGAEGSEADDVGEAVVEAADKEIAGCLFPTALDEVRQALPRRRPLKLSDGYEYNKSHLMVQWSHPDTS